MDSVHQFEIILLLLVFIVVLTAVSEKLNVPYPIALVLGGLGLALVPGLPHVQLNPGLVFVLFLPPVLYGAAWMTSWRDFRRNLRAILQLACVLTFLTTVVVALVGYHWIPSLTLAGGFVLGAIVSPPDAAAATSIAERLHLPRRIVTILEGESLVNDAMGLVLYQFAVAAVVTGSFSLPRAIGQFFYAAIGGIALGLLLGWLAGMIQGRLRHVPMVEILFTLLVAFAVYLAAEAVHVSGVLATVTAGIYGGWNAPARLSAETRMQGGAFWNIVIFLLNGLIFILIGLQLRGVLAGLMNQQSWPQLLSYAALICGTAILIRMLWIFPSAWLPRFLVPSIRKRDPMPSPATLVVVGWTGMRGIVTLAAAMALPVTTHAGQPFPQRDLIVFLAFSVILATFVLQGLTLPPMIRAFDLHDDGESEREERRARIHAARAAIADLEERDAQPRDQRPPPALVESFRSRYQQKVDELMRDQFDAEATASEMGASSFVATFTWIQRMRLDGLQAERIALIELRDRGEIGDEVLHKIERELDLEESRLK